MFKKRLTLKILLFLLFSDILETLTHLCFKKSVFAGSGMGMEEFPGLVVFFKSVFLSPFLWAGLLLVLLTFVIWSTILSKIDLSVAVPIASFSYILVPLVSIIFLHEKVNPARWLGIFSILIGVIFVSLSSKEKEAGLE